MIAPRINAAGRIGAAQRAILLFTQTDERILNDTANDLNLANLERQDVCENILSGILSSKKLKEQLLNPILVISDGKYPSGILGIVASKLAERFNRPVFVFTSDGEKNCLKGSGRSALGINLFEMLSSMQDLFVKFGGHSQAAGVTIKDTNFDEFIKRCNGYLKDAVLFQKEEAYDLELNENDLNLDLAKDLNKFEPFGVANRRPRFLIKVKTCTINPMKNYINHLIVKVGGKSITAFNYSARTELLSSNATKDMIIDISVNNFNNKESLKSLLKNVSINDDGFECQELVFARYIESFLKKDEKSAAYKTIDDYVQYLDENYGTILISNEYENFNNFNIENLEKNYFNVTHKNNNNKIILSPNFDMDLGFYNKVILLEKPHAGYICELNRATKAKIYIIDKPVKFEQELKDKINFDRAVFLEYYKLVTQNLNNLVYINDINYIYHYFKNIDDNINIAQFSVCFNTFLDLKLLTTNIESGKIRLNNIKVDLSGSYFLQKIKSFVM